MNTDDMDQLLSQLRRNARLPASQLAERLMMSQEAVEKLIAECEAEGIIRGYYPLINEDKCADKKVRAIIEVTVRPERDLGFDRIAGNLAKFNEVTDVTLVSGSYDLQLIVVGDSLQDVAGFVSTKLAPIDGVQSTRTHFVLMKYKEAGFQLEDNEEYDRLKITP